MKCVGTRTASNKSIFMELLLSWLKVGALKSLLYGNVRETSCTIIAVSPHGSSYFIFDWPEASERNAMRAFVGSVNGLGSSFMNSWFRDLLSKEGLDGD